MSDTSGNTSPVRVIAPADVALTAVTDVILRRHPHPGERAPTETELIDELRISRESARRALDTLGAAGIVTDPPPGGAPRVLRPTPAGGIDRLLRLALLGHDTDRDDVVGVRTAVEHVSACAAADTAGAADLRDLHLLISRMREPSMPAPAFAELDAAFHLRIAQSASDLCASLLRGLADPITAAMRHAFAQITDWPATARRLADEHEHLTTLISARQQAEAADFVTRHVADFYRSDLSPEGHRADAI